MTDLAFFQTEAASMVQDWGAPVTFRRLTPLTNIVAKAVVRGYKPQEMTGGIQQGDRRIYVMAADLAALNPPLRPGDKVLWKGRLLNIEAVDAATVDIAGTGIALIITARG